MKKQPMISDVELVYRKKDYMPAVLVRQSADAVAPAKETIPDGAISHREFFGLLILNRANRIVKKCIVSVGGQNMCVVDPKIVMQFALLSHAAGIIIFHNHPSAEIKPSQADLLLTKRIAEACTILDIALMDHIIVTETDAYYSFADDGLI